MDTATLVVGQKVSMQSGDQFKEATVTEITEKYVEVAPECGNRRRYFMRFDRSGKQRDYPPFGTYEYLDAWDPRPFCSSGGEPFELVER
jgi:ProQ C-terminal domain